VRQRHLTYSNLKNRQSLIGELRGKPVVRYTLEGLPNKVLAAEYRTALPEEKKLTAEINRTQLRLEHFISKNSLRRS